MITSTTNNKVKRLVAFNQKAKARREEDIFVVEGAKMFLEAPGSWIREIYVSEGFLNKCKKEPSDEINTILSQHNYEIVSDEVFKKISDTQTPQGILSVLKRPHYDFSKAISEAEKNKSLFIVLEDLQDPGNLGTILRAGEGAGIAGIIMTEKTVDLFNPKVIRSTMGSVYRMPYYIVDNCVQAIQQLKDNDVSVYAAHLEDSVDYDTKNYKNATAFLIGNEGNGLKKETADMATAYIKIPMLGQIESLNAAVATTILMYEAARQRRKNISERKWYLK